MLVALGLCIRAENYSVNTEIITPNGDGLNDVFRVEAPDGYGDCVLEVFDNRGREIYRGQAEWDGGSGGRVVPIGTYYYRVTRGGGTVLGGSLAVVY